MGNAFSPCLSIEILSADTIEIRVVRGDYLSQTLTHEPRPEHPFPMGPTQPKPCSIHRSSIGWCTIDHSSCSNVGRVTNDWSVPLTTPPDSDGSLLPVSNTDSERGQLYRRWLPPFYKACRASSSSIFLNLLVCGLLRLVTVSAIGSALSPPPSLELFSVLYIHLSTP
ncbi:hypothetical protein G7K_0316-t1 [Saitoella complicata NRRL Y-17804]|uniref:Uncharacterized protein n=1 Tax=Saitoella complicata (strain BCRC 22490 / CBS 7301 / JCM 7358 / NBRC 10748 / NRRL Y-17804) TaxID=698492 RepID=A0A0E9N8E8_SAICN|nr:hypothetical protein G7K_0316-t1 [Saitoella complicata NRRL Y-17804]